MADWKMVHAVMLAQRDLDARYQAERTALADKLKVEINRVAATGASADEINQEVGRFWLELEERADG